MTFPLETVDGGDWNDSQQQQEVPRGRLECVVAVAAAGTGARGTSTDTSTTVVLLVVP